MGWIICEANMSLKLLSVLGIVLLIQTVHAENCGSRLHGCFDQLGDGLDVVLVLFDIPTKLRESNWDTVDTFCRRYPDVKECIDNNLDVCSHPDNTTSRLNDLQQLYEHVCSSDGLELYDLHKDCAKRVGQKEARRECDVHVIGFYGTSTEEYKRLCREDKARADCHMKVERESCGDVVADWFGDVIVNTYVRDLCLRKFQIDTLDDSPGCFHEAFKTDKENCDVLFDHGVSNIEVRNAMRQFSSAAEYGAAVCVTFTSYFECLHNTATSYCTQTVAINFIDKAKSDHSDTLQLYNCDIRDFKSDVTSTHTITALPACITSQVYSELLDCFHQYENNIADVKYKQRVDLYTDEEAIDALCMYSNEYFNCDWQIYNVNCGSHAADRNHDNSLEHFKNALAASRCNPVQPGVVIPSVAIVSTPGVVIPSVAIVSTPTTVLQLIVIINYVFVM